MSSRQNLPRRLQWLPPTLWKIWTNGCQKEHHQHEKDWDFTTPIENLFAKIIDATEFGHLIYHPITSNGQVQAGKISHHKNRPLFPRIQRLSRYDKGDHAWPYFKEYWQVTYNLRNETETTVGSIGYGNFGAGATFVEETELCDNTVEKLVRHLKQMPLHSQTLYGIQ